MLLLGSKNGIKKQLPCGFFCVIEIGNSVDAKSDSAYAVNAFPFLVKSLPIQTHWLTVIDPLK